MRTLLCIFLLSTAVFANTCLSLSSGNWNDSSKWTTCGGGVPGNGDTAKIGQGHTITVPAGYHAVVGLSAAGNTQIASTATTLSAAITTTSQTAITVASGTGIANGAYIILQKETTNTNEIVLVSAGGGTTSLTIVRAQLGTAASLHANGAAVCAGSIPAISCDGSSSYGANGTGILAIADTGWLTFRGNVEQCTAVWTVGKDAIVEHDSSTATTPSTTHYKWVIGSALFPDTAVLQIRGTLGHRTLIRNAASSGTFYGFTYYFGAAQGSGQFDFQYANIDGCGSSTTPCACATSHGTAYAIARCDHCSVTNSSYLRSSIATGPTQVVHFTNSTFTSSVDASQYVLVVAPSVVGDVLLDTIYTDGTIQLNGGVGQNYPATRIRNIFFRGIGATEALYLGGAAFRIGEVDRLLDIHDQLNVATSGTYVILPGAATAITRLVSLTYANASAGGGGPHTFVGPNSDWARDDVIDGAYVENLGSVTDKTDGDFMGVPATNPGSTTIKNVVVACSSTTGASESLYNPGVGAVNIHTYAMYNNTYCGKDDGAGSARGFGYEDVGSGHSTAPGMLTVAKNNIVFCATNVACYLIHKGPTGTETAGTYLTVDYNWKWNVATGPYLGAPGAGYNPSTPGVHDSTGDPQFVQQRHFLDWCQMLKPSIASWTDCVAQFAKMNDDTGYDSRFTIENAYNWLRDGYRPQNAAVMNAGDTGGRVGAMDSGSQR